MKRLFILPLAFSSFIVVRAQNIGIGITTPRAKFHVYNGSSGNNSPAGPMVVEGSVNTYINLLSPDANETGILFGNSYDGASGGIIYNNVSTLNGLQFRTEGNQTRMIITRDGDVGICSYPGASLDVSRGFNTGGTAILRGTTYSSVFNYSTNEDTYIRAGKNNRFVILNDIPGGRVGIGTNNPSSTLGFSNALGKKITLFPSGPGDYGFGIQPNVLQVYTDNSNSDIAFGWDQGGGNLAEKFRFKGNGAFVVNGNAGNAGQVLQTNGNATSPSWTTPTNLLYNNTVANSNTIVTLVNTSGSIDLPFGHTFTTTTSAKVLVTFSFAILAPSCFACGETTFYIDIYLDGVYNRTFRVDVSNNKNQVFSGSALMTVGTGTHTISIRGARIGPDIYVGQSGLTSSAIYQIIPQ